MKKFMSIDAETNGLQGQAFAIAAVLAKKDGSVEEWAARCPIDGEVNEWVAENVLPQMEDIPVTHPDYKSMLGAFIKFYKDNGEECAVIAHCALPVEVRLFIDAHTMGYIHDFEMPLPLVDVASMLLMKGEDPTSVDSYNLKKGLKVKPMAGGTHNPLYDSWAALLAFNELMNE